MNRKFTCLWMTALLMGCDVVWSQDGENGDEAEITIRLMSDADLPESVMAEIKLPEHLAEDAAAVENAQFGIDTANENRQRGEHGLATADEARERGAEMAEEALENRENRGRSEDLPERPEVPERPDIPTPPNN